MFLASSVGTGSDLDVFKEAVDKLACLTDFTPETPHLNREQEILFHQMASKLVNNQASGKHVKKFSNTTSTWT